ncbi:MAG: hypothetical protein IJC56_03800 [Clostridia bacterium]|nr:hypothetical protein [Clostridia bacterium]
MIIYVTKKTAERFGIDMSMDGVPEPNASIIKALLERDTGSLLREWGANLFYFNGKKCLQVVNFASKFTLFIFDIKKSELQYIGSAIMGYLFTLFEGDDEMIECLERMQRHDMIAIFEPLKNKSMIATLNHNMQDFAWDGERFWDYIEDGTLNSVEINWRYNFDYIVRYKALGYNDFYIPAELFRKCVVETYGNKNVKPM